MQGLASFEGDGPGLFEALDNLLSQLPPIGLPDLGPLPFSQLELTPLHQHPQQQAIFPFSFPLDIPPPPASDDPTKKRKADKDANIQPYDDTPAKSSMLRSRPRPRQELDSDAPCTAPDSLQLQDDGPFMIPGLLSLPSISRDLSFSLDLPGLSTFTSGAGGGGGGGGGGSVISARTKSRRKKTHDKPPEDRRLGPDGKTVNWRAVASNQVLERIKRVLPGAADPSDRALLAGRRTVGARGQPGGPTEVFDVLSCAAGSLNQVTVCRHPHCTCPDFAKGNLCPHVLFVLLRVLGLPRHSPLLWQKAYLAAEVEAMLDHRREAQQKRPLATEAVREALQTINAAAGADVLAAAAEALGAPLEGEGRGGREECAACFDALHEGKDEARVTCGSCHKSMHASCQLQCSNYQRGVGQPATCPCCRAEWTVMAQGADGGLPPLPDLGLPELGPRLGIRTALTLGIPPPPSLPSPPPPLGCCLEMDSEIDPDGGGPGSFMAQVQGLGLASLFSGPGPGGPDNTCTPLRRS